MSGSINVILGHSVRTALATLNDHKDVPIVCLVSSSPRQDRRMGDAELLYTFTRVPQIMHNMTRLEIHFYASPRIWVPAKALTALFRGANKLTHVLLNGMRVRGTPEDITDLGRAFADHPTLGRICLFNIAAYDPEVAPLNPMLEELRRNDRLHDIALRYDFWASPTLATLCDTTSRLRILRLTGKKILGADGMCFPPMLETLKTNGIMKELTINQCPTFKGVGQLIAEMFRYNTVLETFAMELPDFEEAIPLAEALEDGNETLTKLDLFIRENGRRPIRQLLGQTNDDDDDDDDLTDEEGELLGISLGTRTPNEEEPQVPEGELKARAAFEKALAANTILTTLVLESSKTRHTTPLMRFYLRLNNAGRREVMKLEGDVEPADMGKYLLKHCGDTGVIWYALRMRPDWMQAVTTSLTAYECKQEKVSAAGALSRTSPTSVAATAATLRPSANMPRRALESPRKRSRSRCEIVACGPVLRVRKIHRPKKD